MEKAVLIKKETMETGRYYIKHIGLVGVLIILFSQTLYQGFGFGSSLWLDSWSAEEYGSTHCLRSFPSIVMFTLKASRVIHNETYDRIMKAPVSFFDATPQGRILNRFSKDISVCDNLLGSNIRQWLSCLFSFFGIIIIIVSVLPLFLLFGLPTSIIFIVVQNIYVASSRQLKRLESVTRSPIYSHLSESLSGLSSIRAYGVQNKFILESYNKVDTNQKCRYPSIMANRWLAMRLETIGNICVFGAAILIMSNPELVGPGKVGLVISYALVLTQNLNWLVRQTSAIETNIVAVERLKEYTELEMEKEWRLNPASNWPSKGKVEFNNYSLRYKPDSDLVLRGISFSVEGGERVGISSLSVALFRIVEAAGGNITIDGQDISKIGLHDLRESLTIIPQNPMLFSGTLECAHLKDFVSELQQGLHHDISEGGLNLSAGQRQLISCKVLVLDEATAAVDWETDEMIQETIRKYFPSCTILTIAHRLKTILDYDKILVLDKGSVVEFGSPQGLYAKEDSVFHSMIAAAGINFNSDRDKESTDL
ncbi:ATP-binding cassette transporter sub-family C member 1 isoform X5 [Caligus rogercresseyi]|uniref:ATP-binding cassette transporter sub-family C member 1 isoform X5 n=1 Tax=Caligus rogercresseyi TaxID=217165 RepID=A0A7T8JYS1_CALRO|nr:ATP-binding cassette transporter sub-family C member 1 isoform X5 [Caligus rogercresseyi]